MLFAGTFSVKPGGGVTEKPVFDVNETKTTELSGKVVCVVRTASAARASACKVGAPTGATFEVVSVNVAVGAIAPVRVTDPEYPPPEASGSGVAAAPSVALCVAVKGATAGIGTGVTGPLGGCDPGAHMFPPPQPTIKAARNGTADKAAIRTALRKTRSKHKQVAR